MITDCMAIVYAIDEGECEHYLSLKLNDLPFLPILLNIMIPSSSSSK